MLRNTNTCTFRILLQLCNQNHLFSFTLLTVRILRLFSCETSEKCKEKTRYLFAYIPRHSPMTFCPHLSSDLWSGRSLELEKQSRIGNYISHHPRKRWHARAKVYGIWKMRVLWCRKWVFGKSRSIRWNTIFHTDQPSRRIKKIVFQEKVRALSEPNQQGSGIRGAVSWIA